MQKSVTSNRFIGWLITSWDRVRGGQKKKT